VQTYVIVQNNKTKHNSINQNSELNTVSHTVNY